ncbi:MAG TPA: hypothetical protein ENJ09_15340 [Planctomycetes bacterium]|nr:hypothetical protein [Planctomycetota bacterium]
MRCSTARSRFESAIDDLLSLEEQLGLDAHLARCRACRAELRRLRVLEEHARGIEEPLITGSMIDASWARIEARLGAAGEEQDSEELGAGVIPVRGGAARSRRGILAAAALLIGISAAGWALSLVFSRTPSADGAEAVPVASSLDEGRPEVSVLQAERGIADALLEVFGDDSGSGTRDGTRERIDSFVALARPFADWSVDRIAASILSAPDPELARAAARYLGARGDRASIPDLERAIEEGEIVAAAAEALGRIGPPAVPALGRRLAMRAGRSDVLDALATIADESAARAVSRSLLDVVDGPGGLPEAADFLDALAAMGDEGLLALARIAEDRSDDAGLRAEILARLEGMGVSGDAVEKVLRSRELAAHSDLALEFASRLPGEAALAFLADRVRESRTRPGALRVLTERPGPDTVVALLELDVAGVVPETDLRDAFRRLTVRSPERMELAADRLVRERRGALLERYLELLVAGRTPAAAGALVVLAGADLLPEESRQWAALHAGILGGEREALLLSGAARSMGAGERRLLAAHLVAIHRHLGASGVTDTLRGRPAAIVTRVLDALDQAVDVPDSVLLFRVARALNGAFSSSTYPPNSSL